MKVTGHKFKVKTDFESLNDLVVTREPWRSEEDPELIIERHAARLLTLALLVFYVKRSAYFFVMFGLLCLFIWLFGF